jgi:hypothetical protein
MLHQRGLAVNVFEADSGYSHDSTPWAITLYVQEIEGVTLRMLSK